VIVTVQIGCALWLREHERLDHRPPLCTFDSGGCKAPAAALPEDVRHQIYGAIVNADKAGDHAAVQRLTEYLETGR
jgi:hypothetical protein